MKNVLLIGFTGKKRNGKTTATKIAKRLLEDNGYVVSRINFKDALIRKIQDNMPETLSVILRDQNELDSTFMHRLLGEVPYRSFRDLFEVKPDVVRALMREVGTNIYRNEIDNDYWVNAFKETYKDRVQKLKEVFGKTQKIAIIVDDVRFHNERKMIQKLKGDVVKIVRTGYDNGTDTHPSEAEMDEFEVMELNAKNPEELETLIKRYVSMLLSAESVKKSK